MNVELDTGSQAVKRMARIVRAQRSLTRRFSSFLRAFPPSDPYYFGPHTWELCRVLDRAVEAVEQGRRYYAIVVCPPRHGKSDAVSRRFPAYFLGRMPHRKLILTGYSGALVEEMSEDAQICYSETCALFDADLRLDRGTRSLWATNKRGGMYAVGLGGTITGRGAHVLLVDDYLKGRQEAESERIRDTIWDAFRHDLFTRLAPEHAVVIGCTRWNMDDLVGRIQDNDDPDFPEFELHVFPAWDDERGWLLPSRFDEGWYRAQRAAVGTYGWQSQFQGDPQPRKGNLLRVDRVRRYTGDPPADLRWVRGWDLASTEKERMKDDPDYTVGIKWAVDPRTLHRWVAPASDGDADIERGQWEAPERNARILRAADRDGAHVAVAVECVAGYKDAGVEVKRQLKGRIKVETRSPNLDLVARASGLEAAFEAGWVHVPAGPRGDAFLNELRAFPGAKHDDQVAGMLVADEVARSRSPFRAMTGKTRPNRDRTSRKDRKRKGRQGGTRKEQLYSRVKLSGGVAANDPSTKKAGIGRSKRGRR